METKVTASEHLQKKRELLKELGDQYLSVLDAKGIEEIAGYAVKVAKRNLDRLLEVRQWLTIMSIGLTDIELDRFLTTLSDCTFSVSVQSANAENLQKQAFDFEDSFRKALIEQNKKNLGV